MASLCFLPSADITFSGVMLRYLWKVWPCLSLARGSAPAFGSSSTSPLLTIMAVNRAVSPESLTRLTLMPLAASNMRNSRSHPGMTVSMSAV